MKPIIQTQTLLASTIAVTAYFISSHCVAQSSYRFQHYSTRDGLASEMTEHIVQDSLGFIWISYYGGISRFDGYDFKVYQYDPGDSLKSPFDNSDLTIMLDRSGNLWGCRPFFAQDRKQKVEFIKYDHRLDGFTKYSTYLDMSLGPNKHWTINTYAFDKDNETIWISSVGDGLYSYNYLSGEVRNFRNQGSDSLETIRNNWFRHPFASDTTVVTFGPNGAWIFDKRTEQFSHPNCDPADTAILYHSLGRSSFRSKRARGIWSMADDFRTWYLIDDEFRITKVLTFDSPLLNRRDDYAEDKDGNFWFGTADNGLIKYDIVTGEYTQISKEQGNPLGLLTNWLTALTIDRDGNFWIGTREEGISVLRKQDLEFHNYNIGGFGNTALYTEKGVDHVVVARSDTYPPSNDAEIEILTAQIPSGNPAELSWKPVNLKVPIKGEVFNMIKGKRRFWIGTLGHGVFGLPIDDISGSVLGSPILQITSDPKNENTISSDFVGGIYEDEQQRLWITAQAEGVQRINKTSDYGKEGSLTRFTHHSADTNSLRNDFPYLIERLDSSSLVVYTAEGLDIFRDGKFERLRHNGVARVMFASRNKKIYLGTVDGLYVAGESSVPYRFTKISLIKNSVDDIVEDRTGRLWMSNLEGIMCYDPDEKIVLFFDKREGIDHTHGIIYQSGQGKIVTANIEGITIFDPMSLNIDRDAITPQLTGLKVNNIEPNVEGYPGRTGEFRIASNITLLKELELDYLHNNFSVQFSAMEMTAPEKNIYRHKLEGYDENWIETDYKNRTATYTNLNPGTYTFRVRASNHHGVWSENERTLKVTILPPPWRTTWAYIGYGLIIAGLLLWARRSIVQRERLKSNLKLEHVELEKAKEVDRVKTSFFTNISHEFRTPLTLIQGPVQDLLEKYSSEPKTKEKLKLVQRNSDLLLKLINQLLDLAKLDAGNLKVEKSKGEVMRFVKATGSSFTSLAAQKDISIHINVPGEPCYALFDRDKLETILINLINNAIKFTPQNGSVQINAEIDNGLLLLKVKDTGIGIPEDQREKIFERFHQVSESHKEVGTGIGLALVNELVLLLGGTITVNSTVGNGSEFIVQLSLEIISADELIDTHVTEISIEQPTVHVVQNKIAFGSTTTNGEETRPHILVVEDNADLRSFIIESLGEEFYFLEAENGRQGLHVATNEIPDLIISDVMMPEMDGVTMAEKIKGDVRTSHIPLILLTAKSTEASKLSGLESGADDYLTKPFNKQELLLKIRNGITRQRKMREKVMAELMSEAPRKEVLSADEQFLAKVKEEILNQLSNEQLSVESLAEQIGMSRVHLYRKISGLTGMSVNELIRKLRLHRAAQLLQQRWGPVSQVAYEVGFSNLSYFSKVFKEEFGVLPSEYPAIKI